MLGMIEMYTLFKHDTLSQKLNKKKPICLYSLPHNFHNVSQIGRVYGYSVISHSRKLRTSSAAFLSVLLLISIIISYSAFTEIKPAKAEVSSVTITGPTKLHPGETGHYIATATYNNEDQDSANFDWNWYLSASENWQLSSNQNIASLACVNATSIPINLELNITDQKGLLVFHTWKTIQDPYTQTNFTISTTPIGCIAEADGNGWYQYSYNMAQMNSSINSTEIILNGLNNYGTIAVRNGTWNANLGTLPNNIVLTIDSGALGINYTPTSGDYIIDRTSGNFWWNGVNDTYLLSNPYTSLITNATINALIISSTYNWTQINNANATVNSLIMSALASVTSLTVSQISDFNSTVQSLLNSANTTSSHITNFDSAVNSLIGTASISTAQIGNFNNSVNAIISATPIEWKQITDANATVMQLITNAAITWSQITNANLTIQQLVGIYQNFSWQNNWNNTVRQIIGNAAITWSQITNANATVTQLVNVATIKWSQINNANATVNSLIQTYMATVTTMPYSRITGTPSGMQSYSFLIGRFSNYTYYAVNGTDNQFVTSWPSSSSDASSLVQNAILAIRETGCAGIIEFTATDFQVNNINITGGITLRGAGALSGTDAAPTMLIQNGNKNILNFNGSTSNFGFTLENIALVGLSNEFSKGSGISVTTAGLGTFDDVLISRVNFMGFPEYAIYATRSWGWIVQNSIFEYNCANNSKLYALYLGNSGGQSLVTSNKIQENYGNGFYCSAGGAIITGNKISFNNGTNVYLDATHIIFSANIVYNAEGAGVILAGNEGSISSNNIFKNKGPGLNVTGYWSMIQGNDIYENGDPQIEVEGTNCAINSNTISSGKGSGILLSSTGTVVTGNFFFMNGNSSSAQLAVYTWNSTITSNTFNGNGVSGYAIELAWGNGNFIAENNMYSHTATDWSFQNAVLTEAGTIATFRSNTGINLQNAPATQLFWLDGSGYIFALGKDKHNGNGNSTSAWVSGKSYTVNGFDVNIYLSEGGKNTTITVNGNTLVNQTQLTTFTLPAPVGTTITITDPLSMPKIVIVPVP
jgi:hypothetical protein